MARWFTTLLYALMLACASLPASAYRLGTALPAGQEQVTAEPTATALQQAVSVAIDAEAASSDESPQPVSAEDETSAELSELFFGARPIVLPEACALAPPSLRVALAPSPFLDGPQRPPRRPAILAA